MSKIVSGIRYSAEDVRDDIHFHNEYEIIFILNGKIEVTIEDKKYIVGKNNLVFISNLEKHSVKAVETPYVRYCLCLETPATDAYLGNNSSLLSLIKNHSAYSIHFIDVEPILDDVIRIFEKIRHYDTFVELSDELVSCCLIELLSIIYVNNAQKLKFINSDPNDKIFEIQHYIDRNYAENILISELGKSFFISPYYLSHKFKDITGLSPKQYLLLTRLKNATIMLLNTNLPISDISSKVGFNDVNNFIKKFKETYKMSPSRYRHQNNK